MKKQIWVKEYQLNDYLKDGWTHVSNRDGALVYRTQKVFLYDVTYTDYYYLLEKEEVKDTIMPEEDENEGAFIYNKKIYIYGTTF